MERIVVATGNKDKLKEIAQMLDGYEVVGYKDLGYDFDIEETGNTFFENALIKARAVYEKTGLPCLADDSGLMVYALFGAPGVYSARYAGDGIDAHNIEKLLKELNGEKNRIAMFLCCMVYYDGKKIITETGKTEGEILESIEGNDGFGYDPVFYSKDLKKSFGLCSAKEKNSVSHRFRALEKIKRRLGK